MPNLFGARTTLGSTSGDLGIYRLQAVADQSGVALDRLPFTLRILLENMLRFADTVSPALA